MIFSSYLGGTGADYGYWHSTDVAGNLYLTGETSSTDFPTESPFQVSNGGSSDTYISKIVFSVPNSETLSDPTPSQAGVTYTHKLSGQNTDTIRCITTRYTDTIGVDSKPTGMNISVATLSASTTMVPTPASWSASPNDTTGVITTTFAAGETPTGGDEQLIVFDGIAIL